MTFNKLLNTIFDYMYEVLPFKKSAKKKFMLYLFSSFKIVTAVKVLFVIKKIFEEKINTRKQEE